MIVTHLNHLVIAMSHSEIALGSVLTINKEIMFHTDNSIRDKSTLSEDFTSLQNITTGQNQASREY